MNGNKEEQNNPTASKLNEIKGLAKGMGSLFEVIKTF